MNKTLLLVLVVIFAFLVSSFSCQEQTEQQQIQPDSARLLVHKKVSEFEAVVSRNFTVSVNIFNVGASPAFDVEVTDDEWPESDFTMIEGTPGAHFDKIAPGTNITHTFVVSPKTVGQLLIQPTKITYKESADAENVKVTYSTELPSIPVLTASEYDRAHDKHYDEAAFTIILTAVAIGLPYYIYYTVNQKINAISGVKKTSSASSKKAF